MSFRLALLLTAGLLVSHAAAQGAPPGRSAGDHPEDAFRRLDLPAANELRTGSGAPGPGYWQQRADYVIRATLDTATRSLRGEERIGYTNNSPDTLRYVWLQLEQNLFNSESRGYRVFGQDPRFGTKGAEVSVRLLKVGEPATPATKARPGAPARPAVPASPLRYSVNGTAMRIELARPLPPRGKQLLELSWSFPFGANSNRMGLEDIDGATIYEVAQWYPRMAVYDDVRGWNTEQYLGQGEFYLEYGSFDVSLTVPADMLVAATGTLQNPDEVLTAAQRARLARARTSTETVLIRSKDEIGDPASRPPTGFPTLTWHFTADSVRDFAWAAARHFVWDAVGVNGGRTLAMSFYPPSADSLWREATQYAKTAIEFYSRQWAPYPYPYASNVNGIEGGMEYPMIVFCRNRTDPQGLYSVTDHEFGHTWFPMVVGSNERQYGWMDEGFNSFMNHYSFPARFPGAPLPTARGVAETYIKNALSGDEEAIMTPADRMRTGENWRQALYNKPALGLVLLRERITSPERFDPVFREYFRRWAFKHPTPADFFRTMEDGLGEDLSWFWRSWFYTTDRLDQAVDSVALSDSAGVVSRVYLRNAGQMPMPVELALQLADGRIQRLRLPVEIWGLGRTYVARVPGPQKVNGVTIDPDGWYPDVDRSNNRWPAGAAAPPAASAGPAGPKPTPPPASRPPTGSPSSPPPAATGPVPTPPASNR
ncbi:MAG TPA: M1 family metallopeptidase [Gemmatimonadales bacterium]|nr:M1 family metallopeptidase [Gemmatimonadales bacterium]